MHIFRVNRLPLYQMPDAAPGAGDPPPVDPAVVANNDPGNPPPTPAADPAPAEPPAASASDPSDPPAPAPEPPQHGNKGKKPWFLERISEETYRAQTAERERDHYKAIAERLQTPTDPARPTPPAPNNADVETRARERAAQTVAAQRLGSLRNKAFETYADWTEKANMLAAVGAADPAFVVDVLDADPAKAHEILYALAGDLEKAAHLARMDSRSRIRELTRMSMAGNAAPAAEVKPAPAPAPPPKITSRAPPPPPPIDPTAGQAVDWRSDKSSDSDFSKGWDAQMAERARRGRR